MEAEKISFPAQKKLTLAQMDRDTIGMFPVSSLGLQQAYFLPNYCTAALPKTKEHDWS